MFCWIVEEANLLLALIASVYLDSDLASTALTARF